MSDENFTPIERRQLGCARAQHAIFDAVYALWEQRQDEGVTQQAIADFLGRDPGWVSRTLSGPGNWTLRTFGELVEALDGYIDVKVVDRSKLRPGNYDLYSDVLDGRPQVFCPITKYSPRTATNKIGTTVTSAPEIQPASPSSPDLKHEGVSLLRVSM